MLKRSMTKLKSATKADAPSVSAVEKPMKSTRLKVNMPSIMLAVCRVNLEALVSLMSFQQRIVERLLRDASTKKWTLTDPVPPTKD